ncbi:MAG: excinuclease ABC subunit UvrC [Desulfobacterales bacterium]|jgi:excinuclease ABC subunit C
MHRASRDRTKVRTEPVGDSPAPETLDDTPGRQSLDDLRGMLPHLPGEPGVYLMRDAAGAVIYVGKARSLRKRLSSYFSGSGKPDIKTAVLIKKIADIETIVTASEKEALILESNLIKRHRPRYNVILKDDKRYPSLRLDVTHPYPRLSIVRKPKKDGALYFGPYASAHAVRQTLKIINKTFKLRKCTNREFTIRTRPCLHCQMQGCLAPCCRDVKREEYTEMVREVVLFLKGRTPDLIRKIKAEMVAAAERQDFEKAARLRDKMFALERTVEKQVAVSTDVKDRDVIACARSAELSLVTLLFVRGGFLLGSRTFNFTAPIVDDPELISAFIRQYYETAQFIPNEILIPVFPEETTLLEEWLQAVKGTRVVLRRPRRGEKARLLAMAVQNAAKELEEHLARETDRGDLLQRLQKRLQLDRLPTRIECYDNSNLGGSAAVSSMVVFIDGEPDKNAYRRYRIRDVSGPDDYATMNEVLRRRLERDATVPPPDLLIVDGGKGQLNIALAVVADLGLKGRFDLIGIAKKDAQRGETADKIFKPARANPVNFGREADLLLFLQRIRDEAHRFAVAYHRKQRGKLALSSVLDVIPGVGKARKRALLKHFKSVRLIREASVEDLCCVKGIHRQLAQKIREHLHPDRNLELET